MERTADLLARAKTGDGTAFDRLFARALPRLRWFVELRLGAALRGKLAVDDVVQDAYVVAVAELAGFEPRGEGSFVRWLFAIAANRLRRSAAHHAAQHRRAVGDAGPADAALLLAADPRSGPCTRAARLELRERLASMLGALPDDCREAIVQRVLEGRTFAELARELNRSETAVRRLVAAGLQSLGRALREVGIDDV